METIDQGSQVAIAMSDDEADGLIRAACEKDEDVWIEQFAKILTKEGNIETLELNYLQEKVCDAIRWCREYGFPCRIIILKPRQKGSSTITTAALYHRLQRKQGNGLIIGGEFSQTDNLWKITRRYAELDKMPWVHGHSRITNDRGHFANGSSLEKETAQDSEAGRSGTYHFVLATEIGRWKDTPARNAGEILTGVMACVPDLPDTTVVLESTAQGAAGVFYNYWNEADDWETVKAQGKEWKGRWIRVFAPWYAFDDAKDDLTAVESESIRRSLTADEKDLMGNYSTTDPHGRTYRITIGHIAWRRKILEGECENDDVKFDREFPTTPQHAFRASSATRFNKAGLTWQREKASAKKLTIGTLSMSSDGNLAAWETAPEDVAILHRWEPPTIGCSYVMSVDLATGASQTGGKDPDCHSVLVWRKGYFDPTRGWRSPALAARIMPNCRWDVDVLVEHSWRLAVYYGRCLVAPEINQDRGFVELLRAKGNIPIYQREILNHVNQKTSKALGWQTNSATRQQIEETLATSIRTYDEEGGGVELNCLSLIKECETFCVNPKTGRAEAISGSHDDDVISAGIGMCLIDRGKKYVNRYEKVPLPRDLQLLEDNHNKKTRGMKRGGIMGRKGFY
tara:strand:- start:2237 stop:4114 length:1878 start_codon:yes stop_codon:yes gene_type:complete